MLPSRSEVLLLGLALAARAAAAPAAAADGKPPPLISPQAKITVEANSSELNTKTGKVDLIGNVVVSEGNTRVRADRADTTCLAQAASLSTQCANSRWTFQGNVRIDAPPRGSLQSDQAIVDIQNDRIARATIIGSPAVFEQQRADALGVTRGHADQIVYDVGAGTVSLTKDALLSLSGGSNDITSQQIVYDIRSEKVQATSPGRQRVHITLTPQSLPKQGPKLNQSTAPAGPAHPRAAAPGRAPAGAAPKPAGATPRPPRAPPSAPPPGQP
jgi:lipopolysaccharide transport protein LptA